MKRKSSFCHGLKDTGLMISEWKKNSHVKVFVIYFVHCINLRTVIYTGGRGYSFKLIYMAVSQPGNYRFHEFDWLKSILRRFSHLDRHLDRLHVARKKDAK